MPSTGNRGSPIFGRVRVEFVNVNGRACLARAFRDDGVILETVATAKGTLPHDLEHFTVERALGYDDGFWVRVRRGAIFTSMQVVHGKPATAPTSPARTLAKGYEGWGEQLVGEVLCVWHEAEDRGWRPQEPLPLVPAIKTLRNPRSPFPVNIAITMENLGVACHELTEAREEWAALLHGESVWRTWPATSGVSRSRKGAPRTHSR
jgi:hypothetical protein